MSEILQQFETPHHRCTVALPFSLEAFIEQWARLRSPMARGCPEPFSRDEWAYLLSFLDPANLRQPFLDAFGSPMDSAAGGADVLIRPRGTVAVWLPSNASLLGPLTLVLVSLTGCPVWAKSGTRANDLAASFVDYARRHVGPGPLADYLRDNVRVEQFDRDDPRNAEFSSAAVVRIVFGSDESTAAIEALPHRPDAEFIAFGDHQSEAWIEKDCIDADTISSLIKVFAVYGRAGCTSPARVVLLNASRGDAESFRDALSRAWPEVIRRDPPMHVASECIMARQLAAAGGWDALLTERHAAMLAVGEAELPPVEGLYSLPIVPAGIDRAVATLPHNIQTIGYALRQPHDPAWARTIARTTIKRFVPLARMHHFGPVWDGQNFWLNLFEQIELG